jgi:hypothetical protein
MVFSFGWLSEAFGAVCKIGSRRLAYSAIG